MGTFFYTLTTNCLRTGSLGLTRSVRQNLAPDTTSVEVLAHGFENSVMARVDWSASKILGLGSIYVGLGAMANDQIVIEPGNIWHLGHSPVHAKTTAKPKGAYPDYRPEPPRGKVVRIIEHAGQWHILDPDEMVEKMLETFSVGDTLELSKLEEKAVFYGLDPSSLPDAFDRLVEKGMLQKQSSGAYILQGRRRVIVF